jgi:hypothetical protein
MGWTVQGSNTGGGEIFRTCPDWPWSPPSLLYNGYRVFPGGKEQLGCYADPSPPSSFAVMKEKGHTSTPPMGHTACTEPQCLYKGALYLSDRSQCNYFVHCNLTVPVHSLDPESVSTTHHKWINRTLASPVQPNSHIWWQRFMSVSNPRKV